MKSFSGSQTFGPQGTEPLTVSSLSSFDFDGEVFSPLSSLPQAIAPSAAINPASTIPLSLVVIPVTILLIFSPRERVVYDAFEHAFRITSSLRRRGPLGRLQRQNPVADQVRMLFVHDARHERRHLLVAIDAEARGDQIVKQTFVGLTRNDALLA